MQKVKRNASELYYFSKQLKDRMSGMEQYPLTLVEAPAKVWDGICSLFGEIDEETAAKLRSLELPTLDSLADIVLLLRKVRCERDTFLVIDNYQLLIVSDNQFTIYD
ncbi:hypothetical protein [Kineothrix sedimenti]|uniref:Uncharacterized protein n=1 Tax=Kineothrix sedimenti TaxID=3123317 RepID=A0ABZ3EZE4_9FIRM